MSTLNLVTFLGASIALTVTPGPDNLYVVTIGAARGRREAIVTALGMCSGLAFHSAAAALGISALFASSALLFAAVRSAGAVYLLFLAFRILKTPPTIRSDAAGELTATARFRQGLVMNLLNPKVSLFFLSFLPQFADPAAGQIPLQILALGLIFMAQATVIFSLIGFFSGSIGNCLRHHPQAARAFDLLAAGVLATLAIRLALTAR